MENPLILIADDHVIIRRGLRLLIETHFGKHSISEVDSLSSLEVLLKTQPFTHLLLDMQLQDGNILQMLSQIRETYPAIRILIYTMSPEEIFGKRVMQLGANGFLSKQSTEDEVINAIGMFFNNRNYMSPQLQEIISADHFSKNNVTNPIKTLSDREALVFNYLLKGEGLKEIAAKLDIKSNTVATFKARIFDKLGVSNLIDLRNLAEMYNYTTS